jgi:hypothetical protein
MTWMPHVKNQSSALEIEGHAPPRKARRGSPIVTFQSILKAAPFNPFKKSSAILLTMSSGICEILGPRTDASFTYKDSAIARTLSHTITSSSSKLFRLPRVLTDSLDITLPYLIIQVFYRSSDPVNITLYLRMTTNEVFKFCFTTQERKNPHLSRTSTQVLLDSVPHDIWVNLCFDLEFVAAKYWLDSVFESLQQLEIPSPCLIRWIYASAVPLRPELAGQDLPRSMRLKGGIESVTMLISERPLPPLPLPCKRSSASKTRAQRVRGGTVDSPKAGRQQRKREDEDWEIDAFGGGLPAEGEEQQPLVQADEEDFELVYIEPLGCYYCPSNQQYYEMDE